MPTKLGETLERATVPDSAQARSRFLQNASEDTPPVHGPDPSHHRPIRRAWPIFAAVACAVAIFVAVAVLPASEEAPDGPLADLASTAYAQELDGPFEYVDWTYDFDTRNAIDRRIETWAGTEERFERRAFSIDGRPAGRDALYLSRELAVSCEASPGRQPNCSEYEVGPGLSASAQWFEAPEFPTEPDQLRAELEDDIAAEYEAGISAGTPTTGSADGVSGFGPAGPLADVRADIRESILAAGLFSKLVGVVSNPYASPELRGAAYEVMGEIPGVAIREDTTDGEERAATRIGFVPTDPLRDRPSRGESYALYVDPATALVLQLEVDVQGSGDVTETVSERRTVADLPAEAASLQEAAAKFEPPPPPIELPPSERGPSVPLATGPDWEVEITDDRAIVLTSDNGTSQQSVSGYANPPTLAEFEGFRADDSPRKVFAGPVLHDAESVELVLDNGKSVNAELVDAFDLRWAWAEVSGQDKVLSITVRAADGSVLARREGRRVVEE